MMVALVPALLRSAGFMSSGVTIILLCSYFPSPSSHTAAQATPAPCHSPCYSPSCYLYSTALLLHTVWHGALHEQPADVCIAQYGYGSTSGQYDEASIIEVCSNDTCTAYSAMRGVVLDCTGRMISKLTCNLPANVSTLSVGFTAHNVMGYVTPTGNWVKTT